MIKFERSKGKGKRDFKDSSSRRGDRDTKSYSDKPRRSNRSDSDRDHKRFSRNRRDITMTKVTCASCNVECEVPFKPTSNKPVYCDACFSKDENKGSSGKPNKDFEVINEKLDKIMASLGID